MKIGRNGLLQSSPAIVSLLIAVILTIPQPSVAQEQRTDAFQRDERLKVNTDLIPVIISVTDKNGMAVTGLSKNDFSVFDNNKLQEIQFFNDDEVSLSVVIVFDTSGSMQGNKIKQAKESLAQFIKTSKDQDEFFLIELNSHARLLLDRSRDSDALVNKLSHVEPKGDTAFYDAVYLGLERVLGGAHSRKILLVISDGEDNNSRYTFREIRQRLRESGVLIYAIGVGGGYFSIGKGRLNGRSVLEELASASGGKAFFPKGEVEMSEVFEKIALDVRHLYTLAYYPSDFVANGKWHRLKVKINASAGSPRIFICNREGYYATVGEFREISSERSKKF